MVSADNLKFYAGGSAGVMVSPAAPEDDGGWLTEPETVPYEHPN
jgi:hypothetical protein